MPPTAPDPTWTTFLTMESLSAAFTHEALMAALSHRFEYLRPPQLDATGGITATLHQASAPTTDWRGRRSTRPQSISLRLHFVTQYDGRKNLLCACSCNTWGVRCAHGPAVIADLTVHPALREATLKGESRTDLVRELPSLRAEAREAVLAQGVGAQWFALPAVHRARALDIRLSVVDVRPTGQRASGEYEYPTLEMRLMDRNERSLVDPRDVLRAGLPRLERRVFTLGEPLSRGRKGVAVVGVQASLALHLLHEARREVLLGDTGSEPARFSEATARVRIARTTLPRAQLSMNAAALDPEAPVDLRQTATALEGRWETADGLDASARDTVFFSGAYPYLWVPARRTFYPVDPSVELDVAWNLHCRPAVELPVRHASTIYRGLQKALGGRAVSLPPPEEMGLAPRSEVTLTLRIEGRALDLHARLEARYDFGAVPLGVGGARVAVPFEQDVRRDTEREAAVLARVEAAGLRWSDVDEAFVAQQNDAVEFWSRGIVALREESASAPMTLLVAENLRGVVVRPPVKVKVRVRLSGGLLDTEMKLDAGDLAADIELVREALRNKRRWVQLDDGSVSEIQDAVGAMVDELSEVLPAKVDKGSKSARVKLAAHQLGRIERWIDAGVGGEIDPAVEGFRLKLRALAVKGEPEMPKGLQATLRPYQLQGLAWLQFVDGLGAGAILADDMGLGKTVTALGAMLWRRERDGRAPNLVVCPTSVAGNWIREAARFTPALKTLLYHGLDREKDPKALAAVDLVVTTYAILRRDVALLGGVKFRYAILDEAQNIKNAGAQTAQAARELTAERRLALTGTPVENHLGELWSIMDYCNPAMLGSARDFSSRYERGITIDPKGPEAHRLRAMVRPFLLRRTKRDVLKDLPPKQEIDQVCTPTARQRRLYDALAASVLADVEKRIAEVGIARSGLNILTALLRLRQMACDPRLVDPGQPAAVSAKRDAFLDLVRSLTAEDRRVLVFSQFVELLTLWRQDLDAMGVAYEYLDGRTKDRDAVVNRFQTGAAPLFLISLKAGGTGLNLTGADTVIHCDPWWNPAVEDQATDRAHRIGQTRAVTVYRLIMKGTVEERIMVLKGRKKEIADAVIAEDAGALRGLSNDDVRALLGAAEGDEDFDEALDEGALAMSMPTAPKRRGRPKRP